MVVLLGFFFGVLRQRGIDFLSTSLLCFNLCSRKFDVKENQRSDRFLRSGKADLWLTTLRVGIWLVEVGKLELL